MNVLVHSGTENRNRPVRVSSYLLPVYAAEEGVRLDVCEARLDLTPQPLLGILLGKQNRE